MQIIMHLLDRFNLDLTGADGEILSPARLTTLESLLHERLSEINLESAVRLRSKKNVVLHLSAGSLHHGSGSLVAKMFIADRYETELERLTKSLEGGLHVPEVIAAKDGVILMTFIPGELFVTKINRIFDPSLIDQLARWYNEYHNITGTIKGDPRLRNFICTDEGLFGLDFEESRKGHWMSDIGGVAASLLDTDPINDIRKRRLVWRFLAEYLSHRSESRNEETDSLYTEAIADTLKQTFHWRQDDRILALSEEIRSKGIDVK